MTLKKHEMHPGQYASFSTTGGGLVVYDLQNNQAWIMSDTTAPVLA